MSLDDNEFENNDEQFVDELKPGTKLMLGQYTIESFLNAGGFGITYTARDSLNRRVVIKECFPGNFCRRQNHSVAARSRAHQNELKSIVGLFSREAISLSKASHPNIVAVHQVFEENNTAYMALDFVAGRDLLEILKDDPESLEPERVQKYLKKTLEAVAFVHSQGILHRDISPDNILINEKDEPVLIDFGAAREHSDVKTSRLLTAMRVVKDGYSPQEFYVGGSAQNQSCDLYSLAASFYHVIARELPPDSQKRLSAFATGEADPYVPLGQKTEDYPERFCAALDKAMSVLPKERMQSAEEWLGYLEEGAPIAAKPQNRLDKDDAGTLEKSSILPVLLGTSAVAAAIGAGFFMLSTLPGNDAEDVVASGDVALAAPSVPSAMPADIAAAPEEKTAPSTSGGEQTEVAAAPIIMDTVDTIAAAPVEDGPEIAPTLEPSRVAASALRRPTPLDAYGGAPDVPKIAAADAGVTVNPHPEISVARTAGVTGGQVEQVAAMPDDAPILSDADTAIVATEVSLDPAGASFGARTHSAGRFRLHFRHPSPGSLTSSWPERQIGWSRG